MNVPGWSRTQVGLTERAARCPLTVPVRVTVLRGGVTSAIAGRSLDISESGLAARLAADVSPGDSVAVEFLLPQTGLGLFTKAVVRHHARARCGLEFHSLSLEQRAMIRRWTHRRLNEPHPQKAAAAPAAQRIRHVPAVRQHPTPVLVWLRRNAVLLAALAVALTAGGWWYHWHGQWSAIEARPEVETGDGAPQRLFVSRSVMEPKLLYRVDPTYPEGVHSVSGTVTLDVVVGVDGTVISQKRINGPEVLARAAMDSVNDWRFEPYRVNGRVVEAEFTVTVNFPER